MIIITVNGNSFRVHHLPVYPVATARQVQVSPGRSAEWSVRGGLSAGLPPIFSQDLNVVISVDTNKVSTDPKLSDAHKADVKIIQVLTGRRAEALWQHQPILSAVWLVCV